MKNIKKFDEFEQINEEVKLSKVVKKETVDGFTVYIGRNAEMNDILTTEIADPNDIWMHASGVPGSHVVIKVEDEKPSKGTIKEVAKIAAKNSRGKGKIEVVYTEAKNVKKNSKHKTGEVSVNYDKSEFIKVYSN
jgi:predicted ribosome quality control (RQC) complex YloA/Tae2 family protein